MQIIIEIPEDEYRWIIKSDKTVFADVASKECMLHAIKNGTPLPKGRWIRITNGAMREKYMCSICHRVIEDSSVYNLIPIKYPYCHCGAKMEVNDENSN